jgi:endoribonuclease YbeY-like protein
LLPEVRFLLAHGILHLLGYDHGNRREKREMDAQTRRLVRAVSDKSTKALKRPAQSPRRHSRAAPTARPKAAKALARARARHAK